jgi:chitodextrinase
MKPILLAVAITAVINGALAPHPAWAHKRPASKVTERRRIITPPALESATDSTAIIRWTVNAGGGTAKHFGIIHYGTDPSSLDQTATSPIRWNPQVPQMTYRVRVEGLTPATTYYFTVDAAQADGVGVGPTSALQSFTTRPRAQSASQETTR